MKFYISTTGITRLTIRSAAVEGGGEGEGGGLWEAMKGKGSAAGSRRVSHRAMMLLPAVLMLGVVFAFLFVQIALLVVESAAICSSSLACLNWKFYGESDSPKLREELTRALEEVMTSSTVNNGDQEITNSPASFKDLVKDMSSNRQDLKAFAFKTKAMILKMEHEVQSAKRRESVYWHLASHGVPKSLHCLCLKLAEEYAVNALARSRLPPPEFVSRLTDPSFHHVVLLTDNVLAASVVVSSTVETSLNPQKLVFHVITDKKTYIPMHAWFAINSVDSAAVEVKGLHQYDWSHDVNVQVKEMLEVHRLIWRHRYENLKENNFEYEGEVERHLEFLGPGCISLLNHLRIYIPELFPDLNKVVFLDDDVVVQRDLSPLWEMDLKGKVVGAATGRKYSDDFNFSSPTISSKLNPDDCGWLYGMNVFDLQSWRNANITETYHHWLKSNLNSGLTLWNPGATPPALLAFTGHVLELDASWHVAGLGYRHPQVVPENLEAAAVVHFSGPAKPWLEIGVPEVKNLWGRNINSTNTFMRKCGIMG